MVSTYARSCHSHDWLGKRQTGAEKILKIKDKEQKNY
jgi:hypothetical protein